MNTTCEQKSRESRVESRESLPLTDDSRLSTLGPRPPTNRKDCHRILGINDTRAIHDEFRKILGQTGRSVALDEAEAALFGGATAKRKQNQFAIDSAYQGQEGLALVQEAFEDGSRYEMAFVDV